MNFSGGAVEHHEHRQRHFNERRPMQVDMTVEHPEIVRVVDKCVSGADEEVDQEQHKVPVILQPDAIARKHAVMISFQDANLASVAVPSARWNNQLAFIAQAPIFRSRIRFESRCRHRFIRRKNTRIDEDN